MLHHCEFYKPKNNGLGHLWLGTGSPRFPRFSPVKKKKLCPHSICRRQMALQILQPNWFRHERPRCERVRCKMVLNKVVSPSVNKGTERSEVVVFKFTMPHFFLSVCHVSRVLPS